MPPEVEPFLNQLDPRCREVVLLRIQREMRQDDISDALGIAQGTVSKCLKKARELMPNLPRLLGDRDRHNVRPIA